MFRRSHTADSLGSQSLEHRVERDVPCDTTLTIITQLLQKTLKIRITVVI